MTKTEQAVYSEISTKRTRLAGELSSTYRYFNELERLYLFSLDKSKNPAKSNVFDPIPFEQVEHVVSHLFATDPRGTYLPRELGDTAGAEILNEVFKYQWKLPRQNIATKLSNTGRQMCIFGAAFATLHWLYERRQVDGKMVTTFDAPYFKLHSIYSCYPDLDAESPLTMQYFGVDEYLTMEELENTNYAAGNSERRYKNLGKLKEMVKEKATTTSTNPYNDQASKLRFMKTNVDKERILIFRWYTKSKWISICPDFGLVIEDRENPYKHGELPVHPLIDHDYFNQVWGNGEIAPIRSLVNAHNQFLNMRLDNVKTILEPPFKARAAAAMKYGHTWRFERNRIFQMDNLEDLQPFNIPDVTGQTFVSTSNFIKDSIARSLGRFDVLSRNETEQNRTATEVKVIASEQNARLRYKEKNVDNFIQRIATQWLQLNQQFLTQPRLIRIMGSDAINAVEQDQVLYDENGLMKEVIVGDEKVNKLTKGPNGQYAFLAVEPEDIIGAYDFVVESGSTVLPDPQSEVSTLVGVLSVLEKSKADLEANGKTIDIEPIIASILQKSNVKSIDKVIKEAEQEIGVEDAGMDQTSMLQQQMMGAMPQMAPPQMPQAPMPPMYG